MNASNHNHDAASADDPSDQLIDVALSELVGGQAPPDLSSRITAALAQAAPVSPVSKSRRGRAVWVSLAVAVTLLIGVSTLLLPTLRNNREIARTVIELSGQLQNHHDAEAPLPQASTAPVLAERTKSDRLGNRYEIARPFPKAVAKQDRLGGPAAGDGKEIRELTKSDLPGQTVDEIAQLGDSANVQDHLAQEFGPPASAPTVRNREFYGGPGGPPGVPQESRGAEFGRGPGGPESAGKDLELYRGAVPTAGPGGRPTPQVQVKVTSSSTLSGGASALGSRTVTVSDSFGLEPAAQAPDGLYAFTGRQPHPEGTGPGSSGDKYTQIVENPFIKAEGGDAVSTFSIDVDTASYANVRQFLLQMNQLPPPDAVRIEELVNYFKYDYAPPKAEDDAPFAAHVEVASCPWNTEHRLARIAVKGREMDRDKRPQSNLVFLVDVSGSMNEPAKLPLVVYGLEQLTRELGENDHIAIVVYAGTEGLVLPSTSGSKQDVILAALAKLQAGGSTAGGAGIQLAYQIAEDSFIKGGTNRVILCTDGDFNVGVTNTADLQRLVEKKAKDTGVFLSTLGFGRGNLNDAMMVAISDHGNGNYHYIDNRTEARRVLVQEMTGTLVTIAKDVKIQVEFNPAKVAGYRLIGYEKRMLRTEDFNNDKKDAGEIGAGHTVTALYEIVPADKKVEVGAVDELKYQKPAAAADAEASKKVAANASNELLTLKMRYKAPDGDTSKKLEWPITDDGKSFATASGDLKFAASVAGFGLLLRNSQYKGNLTYAAALELAQSGIGEDPHDYRKEFLDMIRKAKELRHE